MISVILTYYRKRQFIKKCLQSIISQTYKNYEVILVYDDDDKEDLKYIKKISKKIPKLKIIINRKNVGVAKSRNIALKNSKGKYIAFLDSDDYYEKNKIKNVLNFFIENKKENILFDLPIIVKNNKYTLLRNKNKIIQTYWPYFPSQSCISVKRNLLKKIFRSIKFKKFPDIHLDFRIAIYSKFMVGKINILNKNLTYYRQTENNVSSNFMFLSNSWWKRRKQAHEYIIYFFKKIKIKHEKNFDYYLTYLVNLILKVF